MLPPSEGFFFFPGPVSSGSGRSSVREQAFPASALRKPPRPVILRPTRISNLPSCRFTRRLPFLARRAGWKPAMGSRVPPRSAPRAFVLPDESLSPPPGGSSQQIGRKDVRFLSGFGFPCRGSPPRPLITAVSPASRVPEYPGPRRTRNRTEEPRSRASGSRAGPARPARGGCYPDKQVAPQAKNAKTNCNRHAETCPFPDRSPSQVVGFFAFFGGGAAWNPGKRPMKFSARWHVAC